MYLKLGSRTFDLDRPVVMGVLNVTPDSFSDGGDFTDPATALRHAVAMAEAGAAIIDIGGESTRPGAEPVPEPDEIARVIPLIKSLRRECDVAVSVDTSNPAVMRAAADAGAELINDVYALRREGALQAAAGLDTAFCLMHMLGTPATMQDAPTYRTLPGDVINFLDERINACTAAGISRERLVVDPGFGFGKTDQHNLQILMRLEEFSALNLPLLVGLSRKRTLGNLTGRAAKERVAAGVAAAVLAVERGAHIVRTHDVAATVDALAIVSAARQADAERQGTPS